MQYNSFISTNAGRLIPYLLPDGSSSFIESVSDTDSIDLTVTGTDLTADLKYQTSSQIVLSVDGSGLKATFVSNNISQFTNDSGYTTNVGTVTSVNASGGTTGLSFTGGPITSLGTLTLSGILSSANGGNWVSLLTTVAAGAATVDFTGLSSAYKAYAIVGSNIVPSVDSVLLIRIGTGAGPTYQSGATNYTYGAYIAGQGLGLQIASAGASFISAGSIGIAAGDNAYLVLLIDNPSQSTTVKNILYEVSAHRGDAARVVGGGSYDANTNAITALRLLASSGTLSGTYTLYGLQ